MPKLLIEVDVPDDGEFDLDEVKHYFRYLMADALSEFRRGRGYVDDGYHDDNLPRVVNYVDERYKGLDDRFKERKCHEVMKRCRVARVLHQGFLSPTRLEFIEPENPATFRPRIDDHEGNRLDHFELVLDRAKSMSVSRHTGFEAGFAWDSAWVDVRVALTGLRAHLGPVAPPPEGDARFDPHGPQRLSDGQWDSVLEVIEAVDNSGTLSIGDDDGRIREHIDEVLSHS